MVDIRHRVGVVAPPAAVHRALTTVDGLSRWWTRDTTSGSADTLQFRFGDTGGFDMEVVEVQPETRVVWSVVDGPEEWVGTTITFELSAHDDWTVVLFTHADWPAATGFHADCTTQWAMFLMSLKELVETGTGRPWPHEVKISDWH